MLGEAVPQLRLEAVGLSAQLGDDPFLEDVRAYREERLAQVRKEGVFPLWGRDTGDLAVEIVATGLHRTPAG